jgi:hypothetical protein
MITGVHEQAAMTYREEYNDQISDRGLWTAVLLQALEDWRSSNARLRDEAEKFFFHSESDFATVCRCAGLEPQSVRGKLRKMKQVAPVRPVFSLPLVA